MRRFLYLIEKEFKHIFRDKFMPKLIFALPIIQLIILPWAADFEVKNINIEILDRDISSLSRRLCLKISASEYFTATFSSGSYEDSMRKIERGESDMILEIPHGFESDLMKHKDAQVLLGVDAINGLKGGIGTSYVNGIISDFCAETASRYFPDSKTFNAEITTNYRFNPYLNSKAFIVPAIIVFLFSLIGGILAALNIVGEKELGTMEQMNVVPISKTVFIASKLLPVWILGMLILTIGMVVAYLVYGLFPKGTFFLIYVFAAVYLTAFTAFGLIISNISSSAQQAILTFLFFVIIFLLMGGIFTPIDSMPHWAQNIAICNPTRYMVEVMRSIYLKGGTFGDLRSQFYTICIFTLLLNIYAVVSFKRNLN